MERRQQIWVILLAVAVGFSCTTAAPVSGQGGQCTEDTKKFCKDVEPGEGRVVQCLKQHRAEVSDACRAFLEGANVQAKGKPLQGKPQPCASDLQNFCKDVEPGEGRVVQCLKQHRAEVSDACRAFLEGANVQAKGKPLQSKPQPCASDLQTFCKDVEPGEGRTVKCLKQHRAEVSNACRAFLEGAEVQAKSKPLQGRPQACAQDLVKFCKDVDPGEGRVVKCLKEHLAEVSDACQASLRATEGK